MSILSKTMSRIELIDVDDKNLKVLREINSKLFPSVSYSYFFYITVLDDKNAMAKLIYYNGIVAGAVTGRLDNSVRKLRRFYILTLGILPQYRRLGLGTILMNHILNYTKDDGKYDSIMLHVKVSNVAAIQFYAKFGFEICETIGNYYKTLDGAAAHVLQKKLKKLTKKSRKMVDVTVIPKSRMAIIRRKSGNC